MKTSSPYGSWNSQISAELVAGKTPKINEPCIDSGRVFWLQSIPEEQGRMTIMMRDTERGGDAESLLPRPLSARSRVHEYGGGSFCVNGDDVYFVLAEDQRVYRFGISDDVFDPRPLTPKYLVSEYVSCDEGQSDHVGEGGVRFADLSLDLTRQRLLAVCECHGATEHAVENSLVAIPLDGSCELRTLASGEDFYSNPKVSDDGQFICWLSWRNPDMPWDATQLWCATLGESINTTWLVAGDGQESIFQPSWSPRGDLVYVSDRNNWWNLYQVDMQYLATGVQPLALCTMDAEFATPQWTFNMRTYGFIDESRLLATATDKGQWRLFDIDYSDRAHITVKPISTSNTEIYGIYGAWNQGMPESNVRNEACFIGASPVSTPAVWCLREGKLSPLEALHTVVAESEISIGEPFDYPTTEGQRAWGFYYSPTNSAYGKQGGCDNRGENEKPPLIVLCHGGPTGATGSSLNFKIQYWTNRGFAVVDVNYRGSTGFGRAFRRGLYQNWGVHDVDDVCAAACYVCDKGWADAQRCIIKGSSAGGYTVLAALAFRDTFQLGTSLYGIGDLTLLAEDTHKFEARYLDQLLGPYPEDKALYEQRSPLNYAEKITCPMLIFQGLRDKVVPPNQAQKMVDAAKAQGQAVAYTTYKNEAHGFQRSETVQHMLATELYFYAQIFDFPVGINLSESSLSGRAGDECVTQFHHMPKRYGV